MTKKQNRSFGFGKRMLSVLLAVLMMLSVSVVSLVSSVSAADTKTIYVGVISHLTLPTGNYKVHYWGSGEGDAGLTSLGKDEQKSVGSDYWGGAAQTFHMYTAQIPAGATGFKVRNGDTWFGGDGNPASNDAAYIFEYSSAYNAYYDTHGEGGESGPMTYTAPVNTANNANKAANLFWATATYYDYLSDEELSNTKWLKPIQAGTGFNGSRDEWYPFYQFNRDVVKGLADSNSSWALPLYFGNFCNVSGAYDKSHHPGVSNGFNDATNSYNVTRFKYAPNNSNSENVDSARTGGGIAHQNESYQGLMNSSLDSNGNLMLPGGTVKAPYFDESALTGKAKVVKSSFPFTVKDEGSYKKYEFNSNDAKDNVYFTWNTSGSETYPTGVNYGAGTTYGVKDGIEKFMNPDEGYKSGYGIFPFNNASNNNKGTKTYANENLDYGFGVRIDVNFRVPAPSSTVNTTSNPIKFNFSGDDDLWMYITNNRTGESQLVLDMGGSHCKSEGEVDFNTLKAKVNNVYNNRSNVEKAFDFNYDDTYTMSVFYMERGLIESNMEMSFTLTPLGNNFIVTEEINTAPVNDGIKEIVSAISEFGFNPYDNNTAVPDSTYGDFKLGHGGRMEIPQTILGINSQPNVRQYTPTNSYLSYSTQWNYWDNVSNNTRTELDSGTTSNTSKQTMINASGNEYDYAELQVDYVNTPNVGSFSVEKQMAPGSTAPAGKTFPATIYLQFKSDMRPTAYTLHTDNGDVCTNGRVNLVPGEKIDFSRIPAGTRVYVVEDDDENYVVSYNYTSTSPYIVGTSTGNITVTNKMLSGGGTLNITKKLDGEDYTGDAFSFTAEGVTKTGYVTGTNAYANSAVNGTVTFDLTFTQPGNYLYKITEDDLSADLTAKGYSKDSNAIYAKFTVVSGASGLAISGTPQYYSDEACTTPVTAVFRNTTEHAKITIKKTTDKGSAEGNVFAVVKVKDSTPLSKDQINALIENDSAKYVQGTTLSDGSLEFNNLPIYQNGDQVYDNATSQWVNGTNYMSGIHTPQTYMVFEYSAKNGYNTNNTVKFVTFPYEGQYSVTFDYVNLAVINPASGFGGTMRFIVIGLSVLGTAALLAMAYVFFKKRRVKAYYAPQHGRK